MSGKKIEAAVEHAKADDIVSIMVEAAEAERANWTVGGTGPRLFGVMPVPHTAWAKPVFEDKSYAAADHYLTGLVVQAQLRALHAAGLGIANVGYYMDEPGYVDGPDLVSVALNHQPQPDANQEN